MAQNANIKAVITAEDRASGVLKGFSNSVENLGGQIFGIAKKASLALSAATTAATGFAVKSAANFEQTRIGLENMLGSADKARVLLKDISKFAAETPFEFPELAQATRQLVAFGFSADDAFQTMKELGDVSAAIGAPINDLAYLMGTLRAQGRAFTIDIRQFAMRGIPIYEYLAKVLNTNTQAITEMIEEGKIGFPEVQKAFRAMTAEGGAFHNTMARQSKSLSGLFSTLKDNIGLAAREIIGINQAGDVREGSIFDKLRNSVAGLNETLGRINWANTVNIATESLARFANQVKDVGQKVFFYLEPSFKALWNTLNQDLIPALTKLWREVIQPMIPVIGTALVVAIGLAIDILNGLFAALSGLINFMADNEQIVWALVTAFIAFKAAMMIAGLIQGVSSAISALSVAAASATATMTTLSAVSIAGWAAAAAGSVYMVVEAVRTLIASWRAAEGAAKAAESAGNSLSENIKAIKASNLSPEEKARRIRAISNLPNRQLGGAVTGGSPYIVGEKGPELFVPGQSGEIVPNNKLSSPSLNITIQAGAFMGTQVEARKFAKQIFEAYKDLAASQNKSALEMMG